MRPTLSILIVAYENRDDLSKSLPALLPELGQDDELIVVENKPGDGSAELVRELAPEARIVPMSGNAGFTGGINAGAAVATGDLLVILNPDADPPAWLRRGDPPALVGPARVGRLAGAGRRR